MHGTPQRTVLEHAYWGAEYDEGRIAAALRGATGIEYRQIEDEKALREATVEALAGGDVVGWFQGRCEFGPRALGNRSILADPRRAEMKERINEKIKFREPFRPFAPAVTEKVAASLVSPEYAQQHPARFMLLICDLDPGSRPGSRRSTTSERPGSRPCARRGTRASSACSSAGAR